jgi:hypothetical protein
MLRYQTAAIALKAFGANSLTRSAYRTLGNMVRGNEPPSSRSLGSHLKFGSVLISRLRDQALLDGRPLALLELGTGWMHIYGVLAWLACPDARVDFYDVWDNRQFGRAVKTWGAMVPLLSELGLSAHEVARASERLQALVRCASFEDAYSVMGARYFVDEAGALARFRPARDASYDLIFSVDVLEHVPQSEIRNTIGGINRLLKPGGYSVHQVGIDDHLTHYDRSASLKQYLAYSEMEWKLRFENSVQYINLVSFDAFREMFKAEGFAELEAEAERRPDTLEKIAIHERFRDQSDISLECVRASFVHRKVALTT